MTLALNSDNLNLFGSQFDQLAERWSSLGLWCTLWTEHGRLLSPVPPGSAWWKTLWNRGQGLRNELAQHARSCPDGTSATLLAIPGLYASCFTVESPTDEPSVVVLCHIAQECAWGEDLARLCSQWQLDEQTMRARFEQQPRLSAGQAGHACQLVQLGLRGLGDLQSQRNELDAMTTKLSDAYEELNLIYRVGASMRVTQQPRDHFERLFDDLAKTTSFTTMAAVLYDTEVLDADNRLIMGGEPIIDKPGILKLANQLHEGISRSREPRIINDVGNLAEFQWAKVWLDRLIAVPVICSESLLGMILVLNHGRNVDFDSTDVRFVHSVVDRSAIYLENLLLYGDLNKLLMGLLHALVSSIDAKDPYTCGHSNRVALISQRIAEKTGVSPQQSERVYLGGLLHDVGKIGISELILCKPGRLTEDEMHEMQKHPEIGARILSGIKQLDDIIPAVLYHHEWISGTGYPTGRSGDHIPWIARVVGLADAFDAMTSGRNYRNALPLKSALAEIRRFAGTQFCPVLVDALIVLVEEGLNEELKNVKQTPAFDSVYTKWSRHEHAHEY